jgi:hypothetical protein
MRKGGELKRCGGEVEYNRLSTRKLVWQGAARGWRPRSVWKISRCTEPTCATIYQRDFNGARNIFLNVRDAVARVNGRLRRMRQRSPRRALRPVARRGHVRGRSSHSQDCRHAARARDIEIAQATAASEARAAAEYDLTDPFGVLQSGFNPPGVLQVCREQSLESKAALDACDRALAEIRDLMRQIAVARGVHLFNTLHRLIPFKGTPCILHR